MLKKRKKSVKKNRRRMSRHTTKDRLVKCDKCGGEGKVPSTIIGAEHQLVECKNCGGRGKVPRRPRDYIDQLYDSFEKQDMTRAEFRRKYMRIMNAEVLSNDLNKLVMENQVRRQIERTRRKAIDRKLRREGLRG